MLYYIYFFYASTCLLAFLGLCKIDKKAIVLSVGTAVSLALLLLVFRDSSSPNDSENYVQMYNSQRILSDIFLSYHKNYFFSFTQYLAKNLGLSAECFLKVQSIVFYIVTVLSFRMIFKASNMFLMALCFFSLTSTFIFLYFNVVRQGQALALIFLALGFFSQSRHLAGYISLLLSVFSHFSALVVVTALFFAWLIKSKKMLISYLVILLPLIIPLSEPILSILSLLFGEKINSLLEKNYVNPIVYFKVFLLYCSLVIFHYFCFKKGLVYNSFYFLLYKSYLFVVGAVFITLPVLLLSSRLIYYPSAFLPILYTYVIFNKKNLISVKERALISFVFVLLFGFMVYSHPSVKAQLGV